MVLVFLTSESRLSISTASQNVDVVRFGLAAAPVATVGFEWVSVGVETATRLFAVDATCLGGAADVHIEAFAVLGAHVELESAEECLEDVGNEFSFNDARVDFAIVTGVLRLAKVHQNIDLTLVGGYVANFPGRALRLARLISINHGTIVALVERLTKRVHLVDRLTFAFTVILLKVAPAAVLIDVLERGPHHIAQRTVGTGLVEELLELLLHLHVTAEC